MKWYDCHFLNAIWTLFGQKVRRGNFAVFFGLWSCCRIHPHSACNTLELIFFCRYTVKKNYLSKNGGGGCKHLYSTAQLEEMLGQEILFDNAQEGTRKVKITEMYFLHTCLGGGTMTTKAKVDLVWLFINSIPLLWMCPVFFWLLFSSCLHPCLVIGSFFLKVCTCFLFPLN